MQRPGHIIKPLSQRPEHSDFNMFPTHTHQALSHLNKILLPKYGLGIGEFLRFMALLVNLLCGLTGLRCVSVVQVRTSNVAGPPTTLATSQPSWVETLICTISTLNHTSSSLVINRSHHSSRNFQCWPESVGSHPIWLSYQTSHPY